MIIELDPIEARVLGALIEKSYLTPEIYPLSFNSLLSACNQKTSRDPVMELGVEEVGKALASLSQKGLARERVGSRVPKYAHYAEHLGAGDTPEIVGILCVLLLRGAQTAAELRVRAERIAQFPSNEAVEAALQKLLDNPNGPFVERLARGRYGHLFSGAAAEGPAPIFAAPAKASAHEERLAALEARVKALEEKLSS